MTEREEFEAHEAQNLAAWVRDIGQVGTIVRDRNGAGYLSCDRDGRWYAWQAAFARGREVEREACAKLVDSDYGYNKATARRIRARGEEVRGD